MIDLIFFKEEDAKEMKNRNAEISTHFLQAPVLEFVEKIIDTMDVLLKPEQKKGRIYQNIKSLISNLHEMFGLMIVDEQKSLYRIPLPISLPMATISTHPEIVNYHLIEMKEILEASTKL